MCWSSQVGPRMGMGTQASAKHSYFLGAFLISFTHQSDRILHCDSLKVQSSLGWHNPPISRFPWWCGKASACPCTGLPASPPGMPPYGIFTTPHSQYGTCAGLSGHYDCSLSACFFSPWSLLQLFSVSTFT